MLNLARAKTTNQHRQRQPVEPSPAASRQCGPHADILILQRSAGNQAVSQFLESVSGTPASNGAVLQRKCDKCREKQLLQRRYAVQSVPGAVPPIVHETLSSPGQPLDTQTRAFLEPRFGHDLTEVRVHTGVQAAKSAKAIDALAYTSRMNIVLGAEQYPPRTTTGLELIAHEVTHILQQQSSLQRKQVSTQGASKFSDWDKLAPEAQEVLDYSVLTRHPEEWIWRGHSTAAECFNSLDGAHKQAFNDIYATLSQVGLWIWVGRVSDIFPTNVEGIKFTADPKEILVQKLESSMSFCHRGKTDWRQTVATGSPGLHVIVPKSGLCTAHIDTISPVKERAPDGECKYSLSVGARHVLKDLWGL